MGLFTDGFKLLKKASEPLYKTPKSIQETIEIMAVAENGIFEVSKNKYSKCYRFQDINYTTATEDEQIGIFERYCKFLNSLDCNYKITINNKNKNMDELRDKVLIAEKNDGFNNYRRIYNDIIEEKIIEGRQGIEQERYLTITIERKNFEEAKAQFATLEATIHKAFIELGAEIVPLNGNERLKVLYDYYHLGDEGSFDFDIKKAKKVGADFRNDLCNGMVKYFPDHFEDESKFCKALFIKKYPSSLSDRFINEITSLPVHSITSIDMVPVPKDLTTKVLQKKYLGIESDIIKQQRVRNKNNDFSTEISYAKRTEKKEIEEIMDDVRENDQCLFFVGVTIILMAESKKELESVYEASRPVTGTASKGAALFRKKAAAEAKKRIKKVEAGKKLAKKTAKKAAKDTAKAVAKETAKETAKTTAKVAMKTATKAAATAAGTAVAPGVGTAIGMAAGYAAGVSIELKDEKMTNRSRKIKFFLDKMKAQENQTDSVAKLVKDLIVRKAITWVKAAAPIIGLVLLLLVLVVAMIAVPVIAVIAILYNSPFALFLPQLESGDTVQTVTSAYVQEFNRDVNTKVNEHTGYDLGELVYVDYEGMEENPSNYYDIMAVYMVKHGVGDTATVMNDTSKGWLQAVVNDMCSYTTSTGTKDVEETDADGNVTTVTKSVLYVNVTLKSYRDMISVYGFNSDQVEMLEQIMSPEFMGQLGYAGSGSGGGGGSPGVSSMTEDEINAILNGITDSRQKTVCSYALHRVGFPYSQDLRDSGNYYDCSSLAYYSWKDAGVDISYGGATTAAAEAQGLDEAGKTVSFDELQPGDLIFYSFTSNGRYKNISHVAVYVGNGKVVEALNESLGVVYRDVASTGSLIMQVTLPVRLHRWLIGYSRPIIDGISQFAVWGSEVQTL